MTNTSILPSSIEVREPIRGMMVSGYITSTVTDEGVVRYGMFEDLDSAIEWGMALTSALILPVYAISANRG